MKPAPLVYAPAPSPAGALELLAKTAALALDGGQSLVPLLNFRLARPELVVDLNPLTELDYLDASESGLRIGALTRQATLLRSAAVAGGWPLLTEAVSH